MKGIWGCRLLALPKQVPQAGFLRAPNTQAAVFYAAVPCAGRTCVLTHTWEKHTGTHTRNSGQRCVPTRTRADAAAYKAGN